MAKLSFIFFILSLVSCSHMGTQIFTKEENLKYGDHDRAYGDFYRPQNNKQLPLVIVIHGGGWTGRSKKDIEHVSESLVSHGFAVFSINYRLAPEYKHPAPIIDLETAYNFLDINAKKLNVNMNSVALWGYSSGGHTASMFALKNPSKVKAVVSGGAPYDLSWYPKSPYIFKYLGAYRDEMLMDYFNASPVSFITESSPAFFLYHGEKDALVEYAQQAAFEAKLKINKVDVETHTIGFWGHANTFIFGTKALEKGIDFLSRRLLYQ